MSLVISKWQLNIIDSITSGGIAIEKHNAKPRSHIIEQLSSGSHAFYRDKIYIIKDIILKLVEYGELNLTALVSFCGLNMKKHKPLLDDMDSKGLIMNSKAHLGKRTITIYRLTEKGSEFCNSILDAYERMFPRDTSS
jgi:predicted transcriptional regulator